MRSRRRSTRRRIHGFTLIELVVVVAIIAALAGLVISKVDFLRRQATTAIGANTSGDVNNNLEMYLTTNSTLPNGMDSLLATTASGTAPTGLTTFLIGSTDDVGNLPTQLTMGTTTYTTTGGATGQDRRLNSLVRMGMSFVNDINSASTNASDSGTFARAISTDYTVGTGFNNAANPTPITAATPLAMVVPGSAIWDSVYPVNVWGSTYNLTGNEMVIDSLGDQVSLVALGIGPGCETNGVTMATPPIYPGPDTTLYYYRYVAIFAVYTDGRRAQLKTVVDAFGRTVDSSLSNYSQGAPDDTPPGSRTPE